MRIKCREPQTGRDWIFETGRGIDLSRILEFDSANVSAFGLGQPESHPVVRPGFTGSIENGGDVNCSEIRVIPHAHGTHTESIGHILDRRVDICDLTLPDFIFSVLVTVQPISLSESSGTYEGNTKTSDRVLTKPRIAEKVQKIDPPESRLDGLIIRTLPNEERNKTRNYSGTNPPYLTSEACKYMNALGIQHLCIDLPSIDREDDGGNVPNHRSFWRVNSNRKIKTEETFDKTVTELIFVPKQVDDGIFMLNLQVPNIATDAVPSRPIIYPCVE